MLETHSYLAIYRPLLNNQRYRTTRAVLTCVDQTHCARLSDNIQCVRARRTTSVIHPTVGPSVSSTRNVPVTRHVSRRSVRIRVRACVVSMRSALLLIIRRSVLV
uniref:Uncharacterized protein n=1 Tax=Cacopsylla melanoneura TaxID=428564 RepID=A0A8D8SWG3_9HEMI